VLQHRVAKILQHATCFYSTIFFVNVWYYKYFSSQNQLVYFSIPSPLSNLYKFFPAFKDLFKTWYFHSCWWSTSSIRCWWMWKLRSKWLQS